MCNEVLSMGSVVYINAGIDVGSERSVSQWLRRCVAKPTVVGSIIADAIAFTDFVPFSKVLKLVCLFPTQGCAEAFILQWIDTAWNLLLYFIGVGIVLMWGISSRLMYLFIYILRSNPDEVGEPHCGG